MSATPVGSAVRARSWSIRASSMPFKASSANGSSPTAPTIRTWAPSREAATAWLAPLPRGKRAQVVDRAVQEVLAQVEEAGPERLAVGHRRKAGRRGQAFERAHENGELEIGMRDTGGRGTDSGPSQYRLPFHNLPGPGLAVPGAAFGLVGLELDEKTPQRPLQSGECGL